MDELKRVHAVGGDEPTLRDKPRWQVNQELPSTELRPGAEKQMLRPWEEEALPLVSQSSHASCALWQGSMRVGWAGLVHPCSLGQQQVSFGCSENAH